MIVILLVADSCKASAPGFAGGPAVTPFLDSLAVEGTWFEKFFAAGAWTIPSVMSMLTGTLGHRLGVCRWRHPFPAHRPTLLTAFAAAGFEVRSFHPYPRWGFLTIPGKGAVGNSQDMDAVCAALRGRKGQDRFVFVLHWWTHLPYLCHEVPQDKWHVACDFSLESLNRYPERIAPKLENSYLQAVAHFSEEVLPRYLDAAGAHGEEVLLAVTGDHGETWGRSLPAGRKVENVYDLHGRWIADETIQVPLVLHGKTATATIPAGQCLGGLASGLDVGPTLAALADIPWPGPEPDFPPPGLVERNEKDLNIIGASLKEHVLTGLDAPRDEVLTISSHNAHQPKTYPADGKEMWRTMALRDAKAWYIWDGVAQEKAVNSVDEAAVLSEEETAAVFARLEEMRQQAVDSAAPVEGEDIDDLRSDAEQVKKQLRSLGYLD
ncbi:MAG TPA: sulfatase-like hydrolase/transferase [bacterium]|nr:sulfatase-like hydrolase/transferase [bacterium]